MKTSFFYCLSVCGGWQTALSIDNHTFGPIFNSCSELWKWQKENLPLGDKP